MTSGSWSLSLGLRLAGKKLGGGNTVAVKANPTSACQQTFGYGTGDDQVSQVVLQERSLAAGASENLDLYDGSTNSPQLLDIVNDVVAFRKIRSFALWISDGGDSAGVTVGNAAANPNTLWWGGTTPTQTVYNDAPMTGGSDAGVTVTTSLRYIKVLNNGAVAVTYTVAIAGGLTISGAAMGVMGLTYP